MANPSLLSKVLQEAREGRIEPGIAALQFELRRHPNDAETLQVLALLFTFAGKLPLAIHHLSRAVALQPRLPAYQNNLGNALTSARRHDEARRAYQAAVELDPAYVRGWLGLASARSACLDSAGAVAAAEKALQLQPRAAEVHRCYAAVLESADRLDEALHFLEERVAEHPDDAGLRSAWLMPLNYTARSPESIAQAHRDYARCVARPAVAPGRTADDPERPLRLGVLSGHLHSHSVAYFVESIFRPGAHPVATVVFNTGPATPDDPRTRTLRGLADEWVEAGSMDDATLQRTIRERRIDLLLELAGHSLGGRLSVLDRKPAPLVLSAIGYPNTTGHPNVDARIVDGITDPAGAEALATERLLRLDPCFLAYTPPPEAPEPGLAEDQALTFGSFNNTSKVRGETIRLWAGVLEAVPGSRLLLKSMHTADPAACRHLLDRLEADGIPRERVEAAPFASGRREHLALYRRVHVALDPTPYNGTTTTCEALWMGVPVVTLLGDRHAARVGASLLQAAGRPDFIAHDAAEYVEIARRLAADLPALRELRSTLRPALRQSALLDLAGHAQRLHALLRACWREYCAVSA